MREELREKLYQFVEVTGKIKRFGNMKFDGNKTILDANPYTGLINPIRFTDDGPTEPIYFTGKATLIINAKVGGKQIEDGHMWIPEDLSQKGFKIGDKLALYGNVEIYKRANNTIDYCVQAKRIEHVE